MMINSTSADIFDIHVLPARYGDSIWIEYGPKQKPYRLLIDGGTAGTKEEILKKLTSIPKDDRHIELIVISHIDQDHIAGILSLLKDEELNFTVGDIWFNGWHHLDAKNLEGKETFGSKQGEFLASEIIRHSLPWNKSFNENAVVIQDKQNLPIRKLAGGMEIMLLSPWPEHLTALRPKWEKELAKLDLKPGFGISGVEKKHQVESFGTSIPDIKQLSQLPFEEDESEANGSSIAFMATFGNKSVLFAADAFPSVIESSLHSKYGEERVKVDVFKISHHASGGNTSPALLNKVDCKNFIISTNNSIYNHPTPATIARVITIGGSDKVLHFNHNTPQNRIWAIKSLEQQYKYKCILPMKDGIVIKLLEP